VEVLARGDRLRDEAARDTARAPSAQIGEADVEMGLEDQVDASWAVMRGLRMTL
jgi:hypothetical protein